MVDKDLVRLQHMLDSTNAILTFVYGKNRENLDTDRLLLSGILRELEILGEAAGQVSQQTQNRFSEIPWKQMIGMRNRLIHAYFDVDHGIVWKTVKDILPSISNKLKKVIQEYRNLELTIISSYRIFSEHFFVCQSKRRLTESCIVY